MKNIIKRTLILVLASLMLFSSITACGPAALEEFTGDLRGRYDYDLNEYLEVGDYSGLSVYIGSTEPTKKEIDARILENRVLYTATLKSWESVGEGVGAKMYDIVDVRYQGYIDGEKLSDIAHSPYKEEGYSITLGSDMILDGVDEQLIGMKIGEKKTITVTVPDPCYKYPYYIGKTITIEAEVTNIRAAELAPYDAEFAEYFGSHSIEAYESQVITELKRQRTEKLRDYVLDRVMSNILENFTVKKYPEKELKEIIDSFNETNKEAAAKESVSVEEYIKEKFDISEKQYNEDLEEYANDLLHHNMVMYYIARKEQIALTSAAFDEKATALAQENELSTPAEYVSYMAAQGYSEYDVREMIWFDMVYDFVYENTTQTTDK